MSADTQSIERQIHDALFDSPSFLAGRARRNDCMTVCIAPGPYVCDEPVVIPANASGNRINTVRIIGNGVTIIPQHDGPALIVAEGTHDVTIEDFSVFPMWR